MSHLRDEHDDCYHLPQVIEEKNGLCHVINDTILAILMCVNTIGSKACELYTH